MKRRLKRIEKNQSRVAEILEKQSNTLVALATDVKHHVKRTDELQNIVTPIKTKMDMLVGALKLVGAVGLGALLKALYGA